MRFYLSTLSGKAKTALAAVVMMMSGSAVASADNIEETFEEVTIVDADGNALTSSWASGSGLSNGWRIIGGTLYANDNGDYGLIHAAGKGFALSDYYFTSASTSTNNAYVFIPTPLQGTVLIWARSNLNASSKKTSTLKVYEATADGKVETSTLLYSAEPEKGVSTWKPFQFTIDAEGGKYIALNLVYTDIDDFTATTADGSVETAELTVSTEAIDFGTLSAEATQTFTVKSSAATSVQFSITGSDHDAFELVDAPTTLAAGVESTVSVKMNAPEAGDYKATLVITAGEQTKRIALTGTWEEKGDEPYTPSDWTGEDFSGLDNIPAEWTVGSDAEWTIDDWWLDSAPALKGFSGFISTPRFTIGEDQALEFYFQKGMSFGWGNTCTVYYSTDGQNWIEADTYDQYTDDGKKTINFPESGDYYLGLSVNAVAYFDDFAIAEQTTTAITRHPGDVPSLQGDLQSSRPAIYDLQGRKMANGHSLRGLIIKDGKKILK